MSFVRFNIRQVVSSGLEKEDIPSFFAEMYGVGCTKSGSTGHEECFMVEDVLKVILCSCSCSCSCSRCIVLVLVLTYEGYLDSCSAPVLVIVFVFDV